MYQVVVGGRDDTIASTGPTTTSTPSARARRRSSSISSSVTNITRSRGRSNAARLASSSASRRVTTLDRSAGAIQPTEPATRRSRFLIESVSVRGRGGCSAIREAQIDRNVSSEPSAIARPSTVEPCPR